MKKLTSWILTLALLIGLCPALGGAVKAEPLASGTLSGSATWDLSADGKTLTIHGGTIEGDGNWPWEGYRDAVTKVVFDGDVKASGSLRGMFYFMENLEEIIGLDKLNTSMVANMGDMFRNCSLLASLDVSKFDTSNVTDMTCMFGSCYNLTSLDVSGFDTSNVQYLTGMFSLCRSLASLDVSKFDTSKAVNMLQTFADCYSLTSLDVSGFDTSKVENMMMMFVNCRSLTSLDVSEFDTAQVRDMEAMFYGCYGLTSLDVSRFDTSNVKDMSKMFGACKRITSLDIDNFNTSNVKNMSYMFCFCESLTDLNISGWNTSNVTNMRAMFQRCLNLTRLNLEKIDISNVTNMSEMFNGCTGLTSLSLSGWVTSNVTNMGGMFSGCSSLTNLDLSHFNTTKTTNIEAMFEGCTSLTNLNLSGFDTSNVKEGSWMFAYSPSLSSITLSKDFRFPEGSVLPTTCSSQYTGNWIRVGGDGTEYTAEYIAANYPSDELPAGTYVWAEKPTHTATFKSGETVIAEVPFIEGESSLEEPNVPVRANYVGSWGDYDLSSATTDITVSALYTPIDPYAASELSTSAKAEYQNSIVTVELSASAPTQTVRALSETVKPLDVVLVLDQSGSMKDTLGGSQTKRDALVSCAGEFVRGLYDSAAATGAEHRVALIGFANSGYSGGKYKNTGLLATASGAAKGFVDLTDADYASAMLPISSGGTINANILSGISSIVADGATAADLGLKMAKNIFTENPAGSERERIVVFITDGTPTCWGETPSLIRQTAAEAISAANTIKNTQNAKIYCVGVEAGADPAAEFTAAADGVTTDWLGSFVSYDFNRFLHAVSSDYPEAKAMNRLGDGDRSAGYYMAVNDTGRLRGIFTNILYNTVYELKTFDKATISYTLPDELTMTLEQEIALRDKLHDKGLSDADITVLRNGDGTTELRFKNIKVSEGYDASGALCYTASVSFSATANQKAEGTVTAGTAGGVSIDGSAQAAFELPSVTVSAGRTLAAFTINGQPYCISQANIGDTFSGWECNLAEWKPEKTMEVTDSYSEFEATGVRNVYAIHWIIDGEDTVESYAAGAPITAPEVPIKDGYVFSGWSPALPATMPVYSLACTATYAEEHEHLWEEQYKTGTCETGVTTHYRCVCGEEMDVMSEPCEHDFIAVVSNNGSDGITVEKLVCTKCGVSKAQNITYKVKYSEGFRTQVLDLSLYQNAQVVELPDHTIELRFYIGETDKLYNVTRIDEDGRRHSYPARLEDGYLVFVLDHFSVYTLCELDESGRAEELTYEQCQAILSATQQPEEKNSVTGIFDGSGRLYASVTAPDGGKLIAAEYDKSGALSAIWTKEVSVNAAAQTVETGISRHEGCTYRLMLVDSGSAPLCEAWSSSES